MVTTKHLYKLNFPSMGSVPAWDTDGMRDIKPSAVENVQDTVPDSLLFGEDVSGLGPRRLCWTLSVQVVLGLPGRQIQEIHPFPSLFPLIRKDVNIYTWAPIPVLTSPRENLGELLKSLWPSVFSEHTWNLSTNHAWVHYASTSRTVPGTFVQVKCGGKAVSIQSPTHSPSCPSIHPSTNSPTHLSIHVLTFPPSCYSDHLPTQQPICSFTYLFTHPLTCHFIHLHIHLSIHTSRP